MGLLQDKTINTIKPINVVCFKTMEHIVGNYN